MQITKYVNVDPNVLIEYIYDDANLIGDPYKILVNIKNNSYGYIAGDSSITNNTQSNQLFQIDPITSNYGLVDTNNYSFLQIKNYAGGVPIQHDTFRIYLPINYTFGEYLGCKIRLYTFDYTNNNTYDITDFYFDISNTNTTNILQYTNPPLLFKEVLWGKNIDILIPSINVLSNQRTGTKATPDSINYNLTNGVGLSMNSPIFIDFQFINAKQVINNVTTYLLASPITISFPQTPEFQNLGVYIGEATDGDYFEIYGTFNGSSGDFNNFINNAVQLGNNYYVQYTITVYEQNILGQSLTITVTRNFSDPIEFRPIIKYSTTTAIIDVQMNLIDAVDSSQITRNASYGMLQNEVSKYSLNLTKINLTNAFTPKIYNVKSPLGVGILTGAQSNLSAGVNNIVLQPITYSIPVLVNASNVVAQSTNVIVGSTTFYAIGNLQLSIYPFDNIIQITIATQVVSNAPDYLDMSNMGNISLVFKNTQLSSTFGLYTNTGVVNTKGGVLVFKIPSSSISDLRAIYNSGINVFYITATQQSITSVIYTGLFILYDSLTNITLLNQNAAITAQQNAASTANPQIILDNTAQTGTAIVTRVASIGTNPTILKSTGFTGSSFISRPFVSAVTASINLTNSISLSSLFGTASKFGI